MKIYDLIIVGSGPAGVSAAEMVSSKMSVLIIERGKDMNRRRDLTSGWFGHGLYTMNRLELEDPFLRNKKAINKAFNIIQSVSSEPPKIIGKYCRLPDFIGKELAEHYFSIISNKADILFNTEVENIKKDKYFIIKTNKNQFYSKKCLISTGKNSMEWIKKICDNFEIPAAKNNIRVGIRVEVPTFRINEMLQDAGDIDIDCDEDVNTEDTRINSFVGEWEDSNILSVFGHGMPNKSSQKTNFMIGTDGNTEDILKDVKIANVLQNDKIRPERIIEYMNGKSYLEHLKTFNKFKKSLINLEKTFPHITSYAIMYAPEVRLRGVLPVNTRMKTKINGIFGAGECTNKVGSLIGAIASGLVAGKSILKE